MYIKFGINFFNMFSVVILQVKLLLTSFRNNYTNLRGSLINKGTINRVKHNFN